MKKYSNIILITIDSLRADRLGFLGCEKKISPNMDKFSLESAVFTNAFSTGPSTPYVFPSVLTSTYPLDYQGPHKIEKPRFLLSEVLKGAGYNTAAFHANPFLSGLFGYNQGWDYFEDNVLATGKLAQKSPVKDFSKEIFKNFLLTFSPQTFFKIKYAKDKEGILQTGLKVKASQINKTAKEFILSVKNDSNPFFLWVHYMDVHGPYISKASYEANNFCDFDEAVAGSYVNYLNDYPKKGKLRKFFGKYFSKTIDLYEQGVECFDQEFGSFINFLKKENLYQDSLIILTSDHGEEFFERGGVSHFSCRLYQENVKVPLLIKLPGENHKIIDYPVSLIDLAPTILNFLEIEKPKSFKGGDLFLSPTHPLYFQASSHFGTSEMNAEQVKKRFGRYNIACQDGPWKYIFDKIRRVEELYNLEKDPGEKNNVFNQEKEVSSKMKLKVAEFEKNNPPLAMPA